MVMVLLRLAEAGRTTEPVRRLAIGPSHDVDDAILCKSLEVAIDRRQADRLTAMAQLVVKRLGGAEAVGGGEHLIDRGALPRRPTRS
jgi:hypothetical protein